MRHAVAERRHEMDLVRMPGVEQVLDHLARKGALLGVATGNLEMIGWIKIEQAGLREWFRFGGFSDHFPIRSELIGQAAQGQGAGRPGLASAWWATLRATSRRRAPISCR
jgi:phosphoglycolate phosphatase